MNDKIVFEFEQAKSEFVTTKSSRKCLHCVTRLIGKKVRQKLNEIPFRGIYTAEP